MKSIKSTLAALSIGILSFSAMSISADEGEEKHVMVQIEKTNDDDALVELKIDGDAEVFNLPEMEVGDSREITTESGKVIYLTRTEDGMSLSVDGTDIDLPLIGGDMQAHFIKDGVPLHTNSEDSIQVIGDLTDDQITLIKDAFSAAGVEKKVNFSKSHQMKFFSIGDGDADIDIEFATGGDGKKIKVIKMGRSGDSNLHVESKVIVIEKKDDSE